MAAVHDAAHTLRDAAGERLHALVAQRLRTPFQWGVHDCCLWAADAVFAQTGTDPAAPWRGAYHDALTAARLVGELGGLRAIGALGGTECPPLTARVGDVGLVNDGERDLLAVCIGPCWLATARDGLGPMPLNAARVAWRVAR